MNLLLKSVVNLTIALVLIQFLSHDVHANPIEEKKETTLKPKLAEPVRSIETTLATSNTEPDEILERAAAMVFRPMFVYKQQQLKKQRVYNKASRRKSRPQANYPYGLPSYGYSYYRPVRKPTRKHEFPALP